MIFIPVNSRPSITTVSQFSLDALAASIQLVAFNKKRQRLIIANDASNDPALTLFIKVGSAASAGSFSFMLVAPGDYYIGDKYDTCESFWAFVGNDTAHILVTEEE